MTVVLVGVGLIVGFLLGAPLGFFGYHFCRIGVNRFPAYKAVDHEKQNNQAAKQVATLKQEIANLQTAYLGGIQLTRDSYLAGEKK